MPDFLFAILGGVIGLFLVAGAFYLAATPRKLGRKSRLAPPSGRPNEIEYPPTNIF